MLPNERLAEKAYVSGFSIPVKSASPVDKLQDWEMGGTYIQVPDDGLLVKLWHLKGVKNPDTGDIDVILEAPGGVAPGEESRVLFSGFEIEELALAFDQNMNPFVAYVQGVDAKIYWYDPLESDMVFTTLPAGCYDLRCCLDEHRTFAVADSDILLSYIRDGDLCIRYQRERYLDEHVLKAGVGGAARLISMQRNRGFRVQWRLRGMVLDDPQGFTITDPFLGDVVSDLCRQSRIPAQNINTEELYPETVPGLKVDVDEGMDQPIDWLRAVYPFDKSQHGRTLHFPRRGRPVVARIPFKHLITSGRKEALKQELIDEKELPRVVNINHIDPTGGFAKNKQSVSRRSNLITTDKEKTINSQVVLTPDQAANAVLRVIKSEHNEQFTYEFATTVRYTKLTTSDVIEVEDAKGNWHRMRIEERNEDSGIIDWEAKQDAGELAYEDSPLLGNVLPPPVSTTPGLVGDTLLEILNLSVNRDQDDELGLYIAARGPSSGWSGYALYYSVDEGTTWLLAYTSENAANIGETATSITDVGTAVEVIVPYPLSSVSPGQIAAGLNRAVIGDEEIQFQTATLLGMVDDQYHYGLTGITRGVLHMPKEAWAAGTRFVLLDESIVFVQVQRAQFGTDIYYKAVSFGQSADEVDPLVYLFDVGWSQTEWPVTDVEVTEAEGGGVTVTWNGTERLGTFGPNPFHSKYLVGYQVKFEDGHIIETTAETVTYPAGLMGTVVEVRARNAITGLGPLADGSGSVDPGDTPVFGFSGSFPDLYEGEPVYLIDGDNNIAMSGGYWDADARGFVVPGVGAKCPGSQLSDSLFVGIPFAAGTYTTAVRMMASSPDPLGSGSSDISQSVTVLARPTHGLLDLRLRDVLPYLTRLLPSSPPWKKWEISGGGMHFYGVDSGLVVGQVIITGAATNSVALGINGSRSAPTVGQSPIGIGMFDPSTKLVGDGTYSIELNGTNGDFWIYQDVAGTPTLIHSGNQPLSPGCLYHIGISNTIPQTFTAEFNGGNETWFMSVTQVGHGGIPVPVREVSLAWAYVDPDYVLSFNGNQFVGATYADDFAGGPSNLAKSNATYTSGKWRWLIDSAVSYGICVDAFTSADGLLGSAGSPNSAGMYNNTLYWCFGGVDNSITLTPLSSSYLTPIMALDADGDTLAIYYRDHYGTPTLVHTLPIPAGQAWKVAARAGVAAAILTDLPGPVGYLNAIVP